MTFHQENLLKPPLKGEVARSAGGVPNETLRLKFYFQVHYKENL